MIVSFLLLNNGLSQDFRFMVTKQRPAEGNPTMILAKFFWVFPRLFLVISENKVTQAHGDIQEQACAFLINRLNRSGIANRESFVS